MITLKKTLGISALMAAALLIGCDSNDGKAEQAGEAIDEAVSEVKQRGEDLGNEIEDACEDVTDENC